MAAAPDLLSPVDVAILHRETRTIAGHTCKVPTVGPTPEAERLTVDSLREHVAGRLGRATHDQAAREGRYVS